MCVDRDWRVLDEWMCVAYIEGRGEKGKMGGFAPSLEVRFWRVGRSEMEYRSVARRVPSMSRAGTARHARARHDSDRYTRLEAPCGGDSGSEYGKSPSAMEDALLQHSGLGRD